MCVMLIIWIILEPKSAIELWRLWLCKSGLINGSFFVPWLFGLILFRVWLERGRHSSVKILIQWYFLIGLSNLTISFLFFGEQRSCAQRSVGIATQAWSWNVFTLLCPLIPESAQDSLTERKMQEIPVSEITESDVASWAAPPLTLTLSTQGPGVLHHWRYGSCVHPEQGSAEHWEKPCCSVSLKNEL